MFWWYKNKKPKLPQKRYSPNSVPILMDDLYNHYIIPSESLTYLEKLGTGNSADVHLAEYTNNSNSIKVAVKTLKLNCFKADTLKEIKLLSSCKHEYIVKFIGWMETPDEQMCIITEYMGGGDLSTYLTNPNKLLMVSTVFNYIFQVLDAMIYLSHKYILHRDLAARNCLLNETYEILKINDFGLSREMDINYEYISEANPRLPFRWLPLEALLPTSSEYRTFTFKGDIWAFGILVWEMFERGHELYDGISLPALIRFLKVGHRLPRPQHCSLELYKVMLSCWDENPANRPTFDTLQDDVEKVFQEIKTSDPNKLNIAIELNCGNEYERPNIS
uniref:receptor protein-tyrosine kinase n=1 Tax=Panagrolaimus davidi TaxID=227884 RepID=A0A914PNH0_9BILA